MAAHLRLDPGAQAVLDHFAALLGIRIALYDADGAEVAVGLGRGACAFCRQVRRDRSGDDACRREDRFRFAQALREGRPVAYRCHAGLEESVVPLLADGLHLGYAMIGQYRAPEAAAPREPALLRAWRQVPVAASAHVHPLFVHLIDALLLRRLVDAAREPGVAAVLERLRRRPGDPLGVRAAAALARLSPATLDRRLRAAAGCGLKALHIRLRLAAADRVLAAGGTVQAAASAAGYADAQYFSRLYRRRRGLPPSAARPPTPAG